VKYYSQVWAKRFGWRTLSPLEQHAYYVFWVEIGNRMDIRNIPDTLDELVAWSKVRFTPPSIFLAQQEEQDYEKTYMVPADTNKEIAGYTVEELISFVPETFGVKALSRRIVICLMEDVVRESMLYVPHISNIAPTIRFYYLRRYPEQPWLLRKFLAGGMGLAALVQRWFLFPRSHEKFPVVTKLPKVDESVGCPRLHPNK
jgi:hypothetical protein